MTADEELYRAWCNGDREAGAQLFERYFTTVLRFFRNKVPDGTEDLVQQTFLACLESRGRFAARGHFRAFLLGIAKNLLYRRYRAKASDRETDLGSLSVMQLAPGMSTALHERNEHRLLLDGLRALPLDEQVVLELYFWERMTAGEIATALDEPEGTIRTRIRRAKQRLSKAVPRLARATPNLSREPADLERWAESVREAWADDALGA
ncbi:MAG: sigma-70 family RNA polymerase sigma factor [Myxococcota bacterium]